MGVKVIDIDGIRSKCHNNKPGGEKAYGFLLSSETEHCAIESAVMSFPKVTLSQEYNFFGSKVPTLVHIGIGTSAKSRK